MSAPNTTPGPWVAEPADYFGDHNIIRGNSDETLAIGAVVSNMRRPEVVAANAHLIAAAPDMYDALAGLDRWFDTDQEIIDAMTPDERADHHRQHGKIKAALSRARGEVAK